MFSTQRLAVRIAAYTAVVFALGIAVVCGILTARAPAEKSPEILIQLGHAGAVQSVAWSPDGKTLASGSADNTVKLWDGGSGQLLYTLSGHSSVVLSVAWNSDGKTLASGSSDNTVKLWEAGSGQLLRTLGGNFSSVTSVAWSPDSKTLASGSEDGTVKLWDAGSGQVLRTLSEHSSAVLSLAWSPDGKTLASGSEDKTVRLQEAGSGQLLRTLIGHSSFVWSVAWSPDGKTLASGGADNTVKLWEVVSGQLLRTLIGHSSDVLSVAWSPNGETLAGGSEDHTVKLWEAGSGQLLRTLSGHSSEVWSVAWSPNGKTLASGSGDNTVKLWEGGSGQLLRTLNGHSGDVLSVAWGPDGKALASGGGDQTVKLWEAGSGQLLRTVRGHSKEVRSVAWSPDGKTLASGSGDHTVKLWNASSGQLLRTLTGHSDDVWSVAWSPDGKTLASGSRDHTVKLWEAASGTLLRTVSDHSNSVLSVAWSPDGKTLASGTSDNTVKLWEAGSGRLLRILSGHASSVLSVAWSPDGETVASGGVDRKVKLWAMGSGQLLRTLSGHSSSVSSVAWNPRGKTLASGGGDHTVKLWDAESGQLLRTLSGHSSEVLSVGWSPDGTTLASGSSDASMRQWPVLSDRSPVSSTVLPGNEWLSHYPGRLLYQSSLQGDQYAAVRFDHRLRPVYPLTYYRSQLQRKGLRSTQEREPEIQPRPIRYVWDSFPDKPLWFGIIALAYFTGFTVVLVLSRRSDPAQVARQFFTRAGFESVEPIDSHTLRLRPGRGQASAAAIIFQPDRPMVPPTDASGMYVVYKGQSPPTGAILTLRTERNREVVPLQSAALAVAVSENTCAQTLRDLEEPYVTRTDPYDESRPITDPTWFFGRNDLLERLPAVLRQGQHVGLFGLRKVGKTSLIKQLRNRLAGAPVAWVDCQGYAPVADDLFPEIARQFQRELAVHRVRKLPSLKANSFREQFQRLHEAWLKAGRHEPFILILDEVDKFFPDRRVIHSEPILSEWVRLFRILRALAQDTRCLSVLATAYRPDVNDQNLLSDSIGENPMFMSFQVYILGSLNRVDTERMVREIGAWKDIQWSPEALEAVYDLCGGHPLVTRLFASDACEHGERKLIDLGAVEHTARAIQARFHKHRIGHYYREGVWGLLQPDERTALTKFGSGGQLRSLGGLEEALSHLEQFGLIRDAGGTMRISPTMFQSWLERNCPT